MQDDVAIRVENLSKVFKLPHEKHSSLKSAFINFYKTSRKYEKQQALKDINFEVKKGEFFGVVGRNGSGKSTLLKILAGVYRPTSGGVQINGKLVPFIELGVGFNPELSGRDNVFLNGALLGFSRKEIEAMYKDIVDFAELGKFMDQKLKNYSSGMQVRLAFSVAIRARSDILLIDEVLAVGDADFQRKCYDYFHQLKKDKRTVIFVTHDMAAVVEYCDRAMLIDNHKIGTMGAPQEIATDYRHLFNPDTPAKKADTGTKRWGDGDAVIQKVSAPSVLQDGDGSVTITARVKFNKTVMNPVFGFVIKNSSGRPLLGSNTKVKMIKTGEAEVGDIKDLEWGVPNIFADGRYYIDIAVQHSDVVTVCDWWEEAAVFDVRSTQEHVPYDINPGIRLKLT